MKRKRFDFGYRCEGDSAYAEDGLTAPAGTGLAAQRPGTDGRPGRPQTQPPAAVMQNLLMPSSTSPLCPLSIHSPPDAVPSTPPVATRAQSLPFGELTWENFERLCHRMAALQGNVEHCARYGLQGEAQEGIDIYARQADGRYTCVQAKRHRGLYRSNGARRGQLVPQGCLDSTCIPIHHRCPGVPTFHQGSK